MAIEISELISTLRLQDAASAGIEAYNRRMEAAAKKAKELEQQTESLGGAVAQTNEKYRVHGRSIDTVERGISGAALTTAMATRANNQYNDAVQKVTLQHQREGRSAEELTEALRRLALARDQDLQRARAAGDKLELKFNAGGVQSSVNELEQLRRKLVPVYAMSKQYEDQLQEINRALNLNAISANEAASAMDRANKEFSEAATPINEAALAAKAEAEALQRLNLALNPLAAAKKKYADAVAGVHRLHAAALITEKEGIAIIERHGAELDKLTRSLDKNAQAEASRKARIEQLKQAYDPAYVAQKRHADQLKDIDEAMKLGALSEHSAMAARARASQELQGMDASLAQFTRRNKEAGYQSGQLAYQLNDVAQTLALGMPPMQVLLQQGPQIIQIYGGVGATVSRFVSYLGLMNIAIGAAVLITGAFLLRAADLAKETRDMSIALRAVGKDYAGATAQAQEYIRALEKQGVARAEARQIMGDLARTPGLSVSDAGKAATVAQDLATALGITAGEAAKRAGAMFADGYDGIKKLDDALNFLTRDQLNAIRAMTQHGDATKAADTAFELLQRRIKGMHDESLTPMGNALKELANGWRAFMDAIANSEVIIAGVKTLSLAVELMARIVATSSPTEKLDKQIQHYEGLLDAKDSYGAPAIKDEIAARAMRDHLANLRAERMMLGGPVTGGAASAPPGVTPPVTSGAPAQVSAEQQRQQKIVEENTRAWADQQRVLAAGLPTREATRAQIEAENQVTALGLKGDEAKLFIRRKIEMATRESADARGQEMQSILRQQTAEMALVRASEEGRGAMMRARAAAEAHEAATTKAGVAEQKLTEALLNRAAAQEASRGAENLLQLNEKLKATRTLVDGYAKGAAAGYWAELEVQIENATRSLVAAREVTTDPAVQAALDTTIRLIRQRTVEEAKGNNELRIRKSLVSDDKQLETIRRELELVGKSRAERERELATLEAIHQIEGEGGDRDNLTDLEEQFIRSRRAVADSNTELRRTNQLMDDIGSTAMRVFDQVSDSIVGAFASGKKEAVDWGNVMGTVLTSVKAQMIRWAVVNPLLNWFDGGERSTFGQVAGRVGSSFSNFTSGGSGGSGGGGWGSFSNLGSMFSGGGSLSLFGQSTESALGAMGGAYGPAPLSSVQGLLGSGGSFDLMSGSLMNGGLLSSGGMGLQGIGTGFALGSALGTAIAKSQAQRTNAMIGAALGSIVGGPLGGIIGGGIGGLIGPKDSVEGYGYWVNSQGHEIGGPQVTSGALAPIDRKWYNESGAQAFAYADQQVEVTNAYLAQRGLLVTGAGNVGGNKNGADSSWGGAPTFEKAFARLSFSTGENEDLNKALSGKSFEGVAKLQEFVEALISAQNVITALTDETPAYTAEIEALNETFRLAREEAVKYGLATDKLNASHTKGIQELEAARTETLRSSSVSLEVRRLRAEGLDLEAALLAHTETANAELASFGKTLEALAITTEDRTNRLAQLAEIQAAERETLLQEEAERVQDFFRSIGRGIRDYLDNLAAGPAFGVSPSERLTAAQTQFDRDKVLATGGDRDALQRITGSADLLLNAGREMYASGEGFSSLRASIISSLESLPVVQSYDAMMTASLDAIKQALEDGTLEVNAGINPVANQVVIAGGLNLADLTTKVAALNASLHTINTSVVDVNTSLHTINGSIVNGLGVLAMGLHTINTSVVTGDGVLMDGLVSINTSLHTLNLSLAALNTSLHTINTSIVTGDGVLMDGMAATNTGLHIINTSLADLNTSLHTINTSIVTGDGVLMSGLAAINSSGVTGRGALNTSLNTINTSIVMGLKALNEGQAVANTALVAVNTSVRDVNTSVGTVDASVRDVNTSVGTLNGSIVTGLGGVATQIHANNTALVNGLGGVADQVHTNNTALVNGLGGVADHIHVNNTALVNGLGDVADHIHVNNTAVVNGLGGVADHIHVNNTAVVNGLGGVADHLHTNNTAVIDGLSGVADHIHVNNTSLVNGLGGVADHIHVNNTALVNGLSDIADALSDLKDVSNNQTLTDINTSLGTVDTSVRDVNTSLGTVNGSVVSITSPLSPYNLAALGQRQAFYDEMKLVRRYEQATAWNTKILSGAGGILVGAAAQGAVLADGNVVPFAKGGIPDIVSQATLAPMALFGEAGPEAIMPLTRTRDGALGVRSAGGSSTLSPEQLKELLQALEKITTAIVQTNSEEMQVMSESLSRLEAAMEGLRKAYNRTATVRAAS